MECQQLSLCIMNAKALLQKGVLNRAAVVPGSLLIPTAARAAQHTEILPPQKAQTFSLPPRLTTFLLSISASPFCIAGYTSGMGSVTFQCCTLYPSSLLGNRHHFGCLFRQISLVASCFPPLPCLLAFSDFWIICSHSIASFAIRSHKSKHKHYKVVHFQNLLIFCFFGK